MPGNQITRFSTVLKVKFGSTCLEIIYEKFDYWFSMNNKIASGGKTMKFKHVVITTSCGNFPQIGFRRPVFDLSPKYVFVGT